MKDLANFSIRNKHYKFYLTFPLFIVLILFVSTCSGDKEPYSILEFKGKGEIYNYSKAPFTIFYTSDSVSSASLIASYGDLIVYNENSFFYYKDPSQKEFSFESRDNEGFIDGKINSIHIPHNDDMIPWFKQMNSTDISALGSLYFDASPSENYIPYLKELAKMKKGIGLFYDGDLKDMERMINIFNPGVIAAGRLSQAEFKMLSGLENLELLVASLNDSVYTDPLPAMPVLKELILSGIDKNVILSNDFLVNNKQIRKLTISGSGRISISWIKPLDNLRELIISGSDTIVNFNSIIDHKKLELLSASGVTSYSDLSLKELPAIRWMTFYEGATQDEFKSFIEYHPDLEVVEIVNNCTVSNLEPLLSLKKLYGLTITDTLTDLNTIKSLKNLQYLSLPEESLKDKALKTDLQKVLPGTRIVANHGLCLGSGWLMLIIPLIMILGFLNGKKRDKVKIEM